MFLGDPAHPDAGIVELVVFGDGTGAAPVSVPEGGPPRPGFFLLSFFVDVDATLQALRGLGFTEEPRRIEQPGPAGAVPLATVHDPDGVLVELIHAPEPGA